MKTQLELVYKEGALYVELATPHGKQSIDITPVYCLIRDYFQGLKEPAHQTGELGGEVK